MAVEPASRELVVHRAAAEVHSVVLRFVADQDGDVDTVADTYIEAEFGSRARTILRGSGTVSGDDLPKKLEVYLEAAGDTAGDTTNVRILVRPTQRFGTWGAEPRYTEALKVFADRVVTNLVA